MSDKVLNEKIERVGALEIRTRIYEEEPNPVLKEQGETILRLRTEMAGLRRVIHATHKNKVVHKHCEIPYCNICEGGLFVCADCGAAEAEAEERVCTAYGGDAKIGASVVLQIDQPVIVKGEDFTYKAHCLCAFQKTNGKVRYIVEDNGRLFIQRREQLTFINEVSKRFVPAQAEDPLGR